MKQSKLLQLDWLTYGNELELKKYSATVLGLRLEIAKRTKAQSGGWNYYVFGCGQSRSNSFVKMIGEGARATKRLAQLTALNIALQHLQPLCARELHSETEIAQL